MDNMNSTSKTESKNNNMYVLEKWVKFIRFNEGSEALQVAELSQWCEYIGDEKYYSFFKLLQDKDIDKGVDFNDLKELAIYDSKIRKVLFPMLLIVEQYIRAQIGQEYKEKFINMNGGSYKKEIKELCVKNGRKLTINNPNNVCNKISLFEFVSNNTFNLAIEIVKGIDETTLAKSNYFNQETYSQLSENLDKLVAIRNIIMHHNNIIGGTDIKDLILNLLSFIPDYHSAVKYITSLNEQDKYFVDGNEKTVQNYVIHILKEEKVKLYDKYAIAKDDNFLIKNLDLKQIEEILGVNIVKRKSLDRVFTHISYGNEKGGIPNNSVYATKGDAVLKLLFVEKLTKLYPNLTKGELTEYKKSLESDETFANLKITKKLFEFLKHSLSGNQIELINKKASLGYPKEALASLFEAISYEIYKEFGMNELEQFINANFKDKFEEIDAKVKKRGNTNENQNIVN